MVGVHLVPASQDAVTRASWGTRAGTEGRDGEELSLPRSLQSRLAHDFVTLSLALNRKVLSKVSLGSRSASPGVSLGGRREAGPAPPWEGKPRPAGARAGSRAQHGSPARWPEAQGHHRAAACAAFVDRAALCAGQGWPSRRLQQVRHDSSRTGGFSTSHYARGLSHRSQMTAHVSLYDCV